MRLLVPAGGHERCETGVRDGIDVNPVIREIDRALRLFVIFGKKILLRSAHEKSAGRHKHHRGAVLPMFQSFKMHG
jgi:hypothetical protein